MSLYVIFCENLYTYCGNVHINFDYFMIHFITSPFLVLTHNMCSNSTFSNVIFTTSSFESL
jgi:hypothetical protein